MLLKGAKNVSESGPRSGCFALRRVFDLQAQRGSLGPWGAMPKIEELPEEEAHEASSMRRRSAGGSGVDSLLMNLVTVMVTISRDVCQLDHGLDD